MHLGKNIRHLRESSNLTQLQFANLVGMKSHTTVGKWEDELSKPSFETLEKIADHFKVDLQALIFFDLQSDVKSIARVGDKDRITRLLEKELDRLEGMEAKIKANKEVMNTIRNIDPDLAKDLEEN